MASPSGHAPEFHLCQVVHPHSLGVSWDKTLATPVLSTGDFCWLGTEARSLPGPVPECQGGAVRIRLPHAGDDQALSQGP